MFQIDSIAPTGNKTAFHPDFNPFPAPLYIVEGTVNSIFFTSLPATEADIREAFNLSYDRFSTFVGRED